MLKWRYVLAMAIDHDGRFMLGRVRRSRNAPGILLIRNPVQ
jgi:hypothetical protein